MGRRVVAIHQPNFLPWLGFFDKLARADVMVLLDAVQFPKKGGTPANRTRVLMNGSPVWMTVPVDRTQSGTRTIREMRFDPGSGWREKMLKTLTSAYGRSPGYQETMPLVESVLGRQAGDLADLNTFGVEAVAGAIGLDPGKLVLQSTLDAAGSATDLLVSITRAVGGTAYMAGGGAGGYQEDDKFGKAGIDLIEQNFEPPPYEQGGGEFVPGLSVVDALMSLGAAGAGGLLTR